MVPIAWVLQLVVSPSMPPWQEFFRIDELFSTWTLIGIEFGLLFGALMLLITGTDVASQSFGQQIRLIRSFRLTIVDTVFLSLCAGIGEEFLFRGALQDLAHYWLSGNFFPAGLQQWLPQLLTSVVFVAIHGYINPRDWDTTKFGLIVLLFIIALSFGVSSQGIWFCIAAHAAYDFLLLIWWSRYKLNS